MSESKHTPEQMWMCRVCGAEFPASEREQHADTHATGPGGCTRGEWELDGGNPSLVWAGDVIVADFSLDGIGNRPSSVDERRANARLGRAAPEMLEALQLQEAAEAEPNQRKAAEMFVRARALRRAALRKATGGEQ